MKSFSNARGYSFRGSHEGAIERVSAGAIGLERAQGQLPNDILARADISREHFEYGCRGDGVVSNVPRVVVRHRRQDRVAEFRFPRQFRLGRCGHAHNTRTPGPVEFTFRARPKCGAFDDDIGPPGMDRDARVSGGRGKFATEDGAKGIPEPRVGNNTVPEECRGAKVLFQLPR